MKLNRFAARNRTSSLLAFTNAVGAAALMATCLLTPAHAGVEDLWITEVNPSTGQVEVTNIGSEAVTLSTSHPFCHRFNYASSIPGGTSFSAGQSRVFTLTGMNATDSDLWLYRPGGFANPSLIVSGLKWGPAANVGRMNVAVTAGIWSSVAEGTAVPSAGQSLQLTGPNPFSPGSWTVGAPNFGTFNLASPLSFTGINVNSSQTTLSWTGGSPPFRVQWRTNLVSGQWVNIGDVTSNLTTTVDASGMNVFFRALGNVPVPSQTARYQVTFTANWTSSTHPVNHPSGAHFSSLIGGNHNDQVSFWAPGSVASDGIEAMAEIGATSTLAEEVTAAINVGTAARVLVGSGLGATGSTSFSFDVGQSHPQVTLVTMIAPSPDWFLGVHGLSLFENGDWVAQRVVDLLPYDAGSDSGINYTSANANTSPRGNITQITGFPLANNGTVAPLGTFTFTRVDN